MREKLLHFITMMAAIFCISFGVVMADYIGRLSPDTLALGLGVIGGCLVGLVPVGVLLAIAWIVLRWRETRTRVQPAQQQPLVIVAGGQALPYPPQYPTWSQAQPRAMAPVERSFVLIGED